MGITFTRAADAVTMVAAANPGYFFPVNPVSTQPQPDLLCDHESPRERLHHRRNQHGVDYEIRNDADPTHALIPQPPLSGQTAALAPGSYTVHPVAESSYTLQLDRQPGHVHVA